MKTKQNKLSTHLKHSAYITDVDNFYEYLDGSLPIPDTLEIGIDCRNNHGKKGVTVRFVVAENRKSGRCLKCYKESLTRHKSSRIRKKLSKEMKHTKAHKKAMDIKEELNNIDKDPLYIDNNDKVEL